MSQCGYILRSGEQCPHDNAGNGLCFWHDPTKPKTDPKHIQELEALAKSGHSLEGFALKGAFLENINLVKRGHHEGYNLKYVDLYRANLRGAHLFMADLEGASLMKADLCGANLHHANLQDANLLGTKLKNARIENVLWGKQLFQEKRAVLALEENNQKLAIDYYEQAEEICRNIRNVASNQGLVDMAGEFFYREMINRRKRQPRFSKERILSKLVDLSCGYGEKPMNVIGFSLSVIFIAAIIFYLFGVQYQDQLIQFQTDNGQSHIVNFFNCMYYSVVTFTTLGYGDMVPLGFSRAVAAVEAFIGSFTMALFVVVFVKKMTR